MQFLLVISAFFTLFHQINSVTWNYADQGPDVWSDGYPQCAGRSQSPINIRTACTTYRSFIPFNFSSAYNRTQNLTITKGVHNIGARYNGSDLPHFELTGGNLNGTYEFLSFHLHWGENYKSGSEHQVNGMKYGGEIHFVHVQRATGKLAVLGMFMQSIPELPTNSTSNSRRKKDLLTTKNSTSSEWMRYFATAVNLKASNNSAVVSLNLASLMGDHLNDFWRYNGSLTVPACGEGVTWTVFKTPIIFSDRELNGFRQNLFPKTYREPQPLYNRMVYRSFLTEMSPSIPDHDYCPRDSKAANQFLRPNSFLFIFFCMLFF